MNRHLVQIYNLRISYPHTDILLFDDDAAGAFRHVKFHPKSESRRNAGTSQINDNHNKYIDHGIYNNHNT